MRRAVHLGRLIQDLVSYSVTNRVWWLIPLIALLALLVAVASIGQAVVPYTIYTMF